MMRPKRNARSLSRCYTVDAAALGSPLLRTPPLPGALMAPGFWTRHQDARGFITHTEVRCDLAQDVPQDGTKRSTKAERRAWPIAVVDRATSFVAFYFFCRVHSLIAHHTAGTTWPLCISLP